MSRTRVVSGVLGIVVLLGLWELAGRRQWLGTAWPPVSDIVSALLRPKSRDLYLRAVRATGVRAGIGYVLGVGVAMALGCVSVLVPSTRSALSRLAAASHAAPWIALGPMFVVVLPRGTAPVAIAVLAVFFTVFVGVSSGLGDVGDVHHQLFSALGSKRLTRFRRLELPHALPGFVDAMRLAAPAAMVGTIFGEWYGSETGIGPLLVASMQNYRIDRMWAAALLAAVMSLVAYALFGVLRRFVRGRLT